MLLPQENISLASLTTFRVGGSARYFFNISTISDLKSAISFVREHRLPFFILGGGSNTLFAKNYFDGVVIKISLKGISFNKKNNECVQISVAAGEVWDKLVEKTVEGSLYGIENLSYIPGSVGGAPIQNIGAYGGELGSVTESVEVFDTETQSTKILSKAECGFAYRDSVFKHTEGKQFIVTQITLNLKTKGELNLSYRDVAKFFTNNNIAPTLKSVRDAVISIRRNKLPDVSEVGTAGSFFKNPVIKREKYTSLLEKYPTMPSIALNEAFIKIPAGWLLDAIGGFKGVRRKDAGVWEKQALVLVNYGNSSGREILSLAKDMAETIYKATGIELEREVVVV